MTIIVPTVIPFKESIPPLAPYRTTFLLQTSRKYKLLMVSFLETVTSLNKKTTTSLVKRCPHVGRQVEREARVALERDHRHVVLPHALVAVRLVRAVHVHRLPDTHAVWLSVVRVRTAHRCVHSEGTVVNATECTQLHIFVFYSYEVNT